jgi:hypothetical protein
MKLVVLGALLSVALLTLAPIVANAEELTVNAILAAQQSSAPPDGIIAMVNNPANTVAITAGDIARLHEAGVPESVIEAIQARISSKASAVAPSDLGFDNLVLVKKVGIWRFFRSNQKGRLVIQGDTLRWEDGSDPSESFTFQIAGLQKVWLTCEARSSGNFCYQINFQIVQGARYRFRDAGRVSGSNTAVLRVMDALRTNFPRLAYAKPSVD